MFMVHPNMIVEAVTPMVSNDALLVTNLMGNIETEQEFEDRNCIKVVCDVNSNALYFSREPIPTRSKNNKIPRKKQVCIIPFRRSFLLDYIKLDPTPLEISESVDMMRVLEHGFTVHMIPTSYESHAVDTLEDLEKVEFLLAKKGGACKGAFI